MGPNPRSEDLECLAAAAPHLVSMLLAPEGDPDAPDIPTPRSYVEAIAGEYSSKWQTGMDVEMASWKSTGTYVDEVPPPGANIVSGMWIFRVKRPPSSPPVFKARYVARGFSQQEGVDFFQTFSPTPKMTTLRVLLHVAAQRDYELHSLEFSTAFLQGSLHEEIWLRRPPGFTGSFPPGTQWSLRQPVYGLRQAPREWHDTPRTTFAALGFAPSTADPSLLLRTDTSLPPFYVLMYVDDLVFATDDIEALAHVKSELQKRHTCTDLGELRSYLGLQITRDRARRTITLTQSHMVQQVLQRFGFTWSSAQAIPLATGHSLSAPPSDESVEPSGTYPELVGCLMYLMTCTRPDLAYPLGLLACYVAPGWHRKVHMDVAKRVLRYLCSTSGMGLVLGGRVSWRSTRSSLVLGSRCEAEIYATAMAAQELRWLTYPLTDLGERPRSPPVLYVDNKAAIALCQEHRLEHRTEHIALRYFLTRELQQRGQLRLTYVATQANTADIFTKALPPGDHQRFCTMLGLVPTLPHLLLRGDVVIHLELALHFLPGLTAASPVMASLNVLTFDAEGRAVDFEVWLDDLQLFLQCDSKDGLSLFDLTSGASTAPTADAASTVRSQWLTRDAAARLAVGNHLPSTERAHFSQYKSARALYDAVVAHYSSPTTTALSRLMMPYLFPDLATVADLVSRAGSASPLTPPPRVRGQGHERYFLLVVDDYSRYTTVFPLRIKDLPVLRLHSDRGGEFSSDLLRAFCRSESICQTFTLPASPQQNGIAERRIGMVMDVARTSMIHAAAPHFLWPFAVQYAAHQINLHSRVSLPETTPTLQWTGKVGDASAFRVWGSRAFVRDTTADKLSSRAVPCVFLGFPPDAPRWQFYHPTSRRVLSSLDVTLDESVSYYRLFPYRTASPPPPPLFLAPGTPLVDPLPPKGPAPSGVSQVDPAEPVEVAVDSGAARGAETGGAETGGAESRGALGVPSRREPLSPQRLRATGGAGVAGGGAGAGAAGGAAGAGAAGGATGAVGAGGAPGATIGAGPAGRGAGARGTGGGAGAGAAAGAVGAGGATGATGGAGAAGGGAGAGGAGGAAGAGAGAAGGATGTGDPRAEGTGSVSAVSRGAARPRPYYVPLLQQVLGSPPSPESDSLRAASPTVTRFLATAVTDPLFESSSASALVAELVDFAAACRLDYATSLVAESASASVCPPSVGGECALGTDVLEDRQEDLECFAAASPHLVSMLLAPEGDPDALDIPTPRSYAEAIEGPYSSQWQAAMDAEMASWKFTGTYIDEVPLPGVNIVSGMWIFRVKRPPGSPPAFKARYVARGFSQRQGVDFFQTFSPTLKMTTLRVLLHVAAQRDYELHSLDFSTAFLLGSLHEEI
ncbi:unnamed protein product [Closterium sp. NIES-53]